MPDEGRRPLQRLTPLRDDPAAAWLSTSGRLRVGLTAVLGWGTFVVAVIALKIALSTFLRWHPALFFVPRRLVYVAIGMLVVAIRPAVRRAILRQQSLRTADSLRRGAAATALSIDDWEQLASTPEDQPV